MPLSEEERANIRERELLKSEIRAELWEKPAEGHLSKFFRHEAILLMIGFGLTTLAGGYLADKWRQGSWLNQQKYLFQQRKLDKRYQLIDEFIRSISETNTAAEDLLSLYSFDERWTARDFDERQSYWQTTSRKWRTNSKVLRVKLGAYFTNRQIQTVFEDIVDSRRRLGNIIRNLHPNELKAALSEPNSRAGLKEKTKAQRDEALDLIERMTKLVHQCASMMTAEIGQASLGS